MSSALMNGPLHSGVVITGAGVLTPLGVSLGGLSTALWGGASVLRPDPELTRHLPPLGQPAVQPTDRPPGALQPPAALWTARVGEFGAAAAIDAGRRRRMPRLGQLAVVAARQALGLGPGEPAASSPVLQRYGGEGLAVVLGTGLGTLDLTVEFQKSFIEGGAQAASPAVFPYTVMNTMAALVAMELGLLGANQTVNHRDLSFSESVATGAELLLCGRADAVLAGGCDELSPWLVHGLMSLGALSCGAALHQTAQTDLAELAQRPPMRPYDRTRSGLSVGEGAVVVLLERADAAAARGAKVLARLAGIGRGGDDRSRVGWQHRGEAPAIEGAARSVDRALEEAALTAWQLDYVSGSGNGTELERVETAALRRSLGAEADEVPISSVLGQSGEWLTSAGLRLGAALCALADQRLPGTALCTDPDPEASLPGLVREPRAAEVKSVLIPSFAQGGGSVSLVLTRG